MSLMKKILIWLTVTMISMSVFSVSASTITGPDSQESYSPSPRVVEPRADQIELNYRIYNGVYQFRRWNATQNCWVDPYWIDL